MDSLDTAYRNLLGVCDGRALAGFTPSLHGVGDSLDEPARRFAGWLETLGEGARRFTAETGSYIRRHGGGGCLGQYCADGQMVQFCDYAVAHWDNIEGAAKVIRAREVALASEGRFFPLDGSMGSVRQRPVAPLMAGAPPMRPGKFRMLLKDAKRLRGTGLGALHGDPGEDAEAYVDREIDANMAMLCTASFGVVESGPSEYMVDLGEFGVAGFERVMDVPYAEVQHLRGADGTLGGAGAPFYLGGPGLGGPIGSFFQRLWEGVKGVFKKAFDWLGKVVKRAVNAIKQAVAWTIEKAKQVVSWTAEKLTEFKVHMQGTFDKIGAALGRAFTFVKNGVVYIWDKFKGFCKKVGDRIVQVAERVWELVKAFAERVAEVFKRFARYLNPRNVIGRAVIMSQVRNGRNGIATGVYYGMIGAEEARRLGVTGQRFNDSQAAYERLRREYVEEFAGSEEALKKYIRTGFGRWDGRHRTEEDARRDISAAAAKMDEDQLVADTQEEVKRREGLSGGLGFVLTGTIVTMILSALVALFTLVKAILDFINNKEARKYDKESFDKRSEEVRREEKHQMELQDKSIAENRENRRAEVEKAAQAQAHEGRLVADLSRVTIIGLGIAAALSLLKGYQRGRAIRAAVGPIRGAVGPGRAA